MGTLTHGYRFDIVTVLTFLLFEVFASDEPVLLRLVSAKTPPVAGNCFTFLLTAT